MINDATTTNESNAPTSQACNTKTMFWMTLNAVAMGILSGVLTHTYLGSYTNNNPTSSASAPERVVVSPSLAQQQDPLDKQFAAPLIMPHVVEDDEEEAQFDVDLALLPRNAASTRTAGVSRALGMKSMMKKSTKGEIKCIPLYPTPAPTMGKGYRQRRQLSEVDPESDPFAVEEEANNRARGSAFFTPPSYDNNEDENEEDDDEDESDDEDDEFGLEDEQDETDLEFDNHTAQASAGGGAAATESSLATSRHRLLMGMKKKDKKGMGMSGMSAKNEKKGKKKDMIMSKKSSSTSAPTFFCSDAPSMQPSNIPSQVPSAAITSLTPSFFPSSQPSEQVLTFASQTCLVQGNCILSHANALSSNYNEPAYCLFTSEAAATLSGTVNLGAGDTLTVDGVAMTGAAVTVNVGSIVEFIADSGPGSAGTGFVLCLR